MTLVVISIDRDKLPKCTDEQFEAWVKYQVSALGGISFDNPLHDMDIEAEVREVG